MPLSVEDQLRQLGAAYDDVVDDVTADEVAAIDATSIRTGRRVWLLPAAAIVLVVAGIVAIALVARESRTTSDEDNALVDIPAGSLPSGVSLQANVDTEVGRFELYDHPEDVRSDDELRCLYLRTEQEAHGGCWGLGFIGTGQAAASLIVDGRRVVFGLLPSSDESRAALQVGTVPMEEQAPVPPDDDRTVDADGNGIWFIVAEDGETHFIGETWCCQTTGPIPEAPNESATIPSVVPNTRATPPDLPVAAPVTIAEGARRAGRQLITVDGARTGLDGRSIEVFFEGSAECALTYVPQITVDSATDVEFVVDGVRPARPRDDGGVPTECSAEGAELTLVVPLEQELGGRNVTLNDRSLDVLDVASPALPGVLPAGWSQVDLRPSERAPEVLWERSWAPTIVGCSAGGGGVTLLSGPSESFFTINEIGVPTGSIDINGFAAPFVDPGDGSTIWLGVQAFGRTLVLRTNQPCRDAPELTVDDLASIARSFQPPPELTDLLSEEDGSVTSPLTTEPDVARTPPDVVIGSPLGTNPFDGVRTRSDGRGLLVWFVGAAEYEPGDHCTMRYVPSVVETPGEVVLTIVGERPAQVTDDQSGCTAEGHLRFLALPLADPLGGRPVVFEDEQLPVVDGATLLETGWVPDEWTVVLEGRGFLEAPTWFREWQPPVFGRCADGLSGLTLFEGPSPFIADFAVDGRERDLGTFDINGSPGQILVFPTGTAARLAWTAGDRDYLIRASLCSDDEERSIASLLRFALDLRQR